MSEARRRRVMLESDEEEGNQHGEEAFVTPRATPPARAPPKRRRMKVAAAAAADEDEGGDDAALMDDSGDEMERKRSKQLAARWSQLEEDSDHDSSDGSGGGAGGGHGGRLALVQLRVQDAWRRSTPSRKTNRLLVKDPRSGDDDSDSDGLAGFIVHSQDEEGEEAEEAEEEERKPRAITRGRKSTGKSGGRGGGGGGDKTDSDDTTRDGPENIFSRRKSKVNRACQGETAVRAGTRRSSRRAQKAEGTEVVIESSEEDEHAEVNSKGTGRKGKGKGKTRRERPSESAVAGRDDKGKGKTNRTRSMGGKRVVSSGEDEGDGGEERALRGAKGARRGGGGGRRIATRGTHASVATAASSSSSDDGGPSSEVVGAKRNNRGTGKGRVAVPAASAERRDSSSAGDSDGSEDFGLAGGGGGGGGKRKGERGTARATKGDGSRKEAEGGGVAEGEAAASPKGKVVGRRGHERTCKAKRKTDAAGVGGESAGPANSVSDAEEQEEEENGKAKGGKAKGGKAKENKVKAGRKKGGGKRSRKGHTGATAEETDEVEGASIRTGRVGTRRRSSMVNYRAMLGDSSDGSDSGSLAVERHGGVEESASSGWEGEDDGDDEEKEEEEGDDKEFDKRCGRDEDVDRDDGVAVTLLEDEEEEEDDDDEDEEEEHEKTDADGRRQKRKRTKSKGSSRSIKKGRLGGRRGSRYGVFPESEEESSEDEDGNDMDADEEEGDASFSHAAFFQEMLQTQDEGVSSLWLESMTLREAFLYYVEYLAKAAAGDGAGQAFVKKYVEQPGLPEHARYSKAKDMIEKKVCVSRESLCGTWRQEFRDSIFRYPHYGYQRVDQLAQPKAHCSACNRSSMTKSIVFLSGSAYDSRRVWDGLRWDRHLPEHWDDPEAMAVSKQETQATHFLGETCEHKSHLYHSLVHYKLYLLCRVTAKVRADDKLEPENFRGEGGPQNSKRKKKRCLNFTENEFESLSELLSKANELSGVKWGGRAGLRHGQGKSSMQMGAGSSILDWLSGEAQAGEYGELALEVDGRGGAEEEETEEEEEDEEEFTVGRGRRWRTIGSGGGRYG